MPIGSRSDFDVEQVGRIARQSKNLDQVRRLLAPAATYCGCRRRQAAAIGKVTLQSSEPIVRRKAADRYGVIIVIGEIQSV